jgi:transposase-like protein
MGQALSVSEYGNSYTAQERAVKCEIALAAYEKHGTLSAACRSAQISRHTLAAWMQQDPILKKRFQEADETVTDDIEETAIQLAKDGDGRVCIHLLQSRRERYKQKLLVETNVDLNVANVVEAMRQICLAQPTLTPMIRDVLQQAIERLPA